MLEEESPLIEIKDYGCLIYNSKPECKNCNGFGINSDKNERIKECYKTLEDIKDDLGLK